MDIKLCEVNELEFMRGICFWLDILFNNENLYSDVAKSQC